MKSLLLIITIVTTTVINAQPFFLGMNDGGGESMNGNIFSFDASNNTFVNEHNFFEPEGAAGLQDLIEYNGRLYGSIANYIFSYGIANNDYKKHGVAGGGASGNLTLIGGKLYGATYNYGTNLQGSIFEFDPTNEVITTLYNFDNVGTSSGRYPVGGIFHASNGKLYGLASDGGTNSDGVIFSYDVITNVFTKHFDFNNQTTGKTPTGNLMQAANGLLYGFTKFGGTNNQGTMFSYNITTNTHSVVHHFSNSTGGNNPEFGLFEASNGKLYGISYGDIFEFDNATNTYTRKIVGLAATLNGNFIEPNSGKLIAQAVNQKIYEYDLLTGSLVLLHNPQGFALSNNYPGSSSLGGLHNSSLIKASNGKIYGTTSNGGHGGDGTLFEYDLLLDSMETKIHFGLKTISKAQSVLMKASNGRFYGCSREGGNYNDGTFFEYNEATNQTTVLVHFKDSMGINPRNLIEENGVIYGIGHGYFYGSSNVRGIVFKYNISQNTYSFNANTVGFFATANPVTNGFIKATNGYLYALLGDYIVHYDIALDSLIVDKSIYSGSGTPRGAEGMLMQASSGLLYGTSRSGGVYNDGTLFSYNIATDTLILVQNLYTGIGEHPTGAPVEAANGMIYFTAYSGGNYSDGTILEYNPTAGTTVRKQNFRSSNTGVWPSGHMTLASDGNIYGILTGGGSGGFAGVIYKYQPGTTIITKLHGYAIEDGNPFVNNGLVEYLPSSSAIKEIEQGQYYNIYPNPTSGRFVVESDEKITTVEVYSSIGHSVLQIKNTNANQASIDLSNFPAGLYFLRVNNGNTLNKVIVR